MTTKLTRISVPVGEDELEALRTAARRDLRGTRDQARYLLRVALGLEVGGGMVPEKHSTAGHVVTDTGGAVGI